MWLWRRWSRRAIWLGLPRMTSRSAGAVTEPAAGLGPEPLVGRSEGSGGSGPGQGGGTGEGAGLDGQDLQVVVQHQDLVALQPSGVGGDDRGAVEGLDGLRADPHVEPAPDVAGRDRVEAATDRDSALAVDAVAGHHGDIEPGVGGHPGARLRPGVQGQGSAPLSAAIMGQVCLVLLARRLPQPSGGTALRSGWGSRANRQAVSRRCALPVLWRFGTLALMSVRSSWTSFMHRWASKVRRTTRFRASPSSAGSRGAPATRRPPRRSDDVAALRVLHLRQWAMGRVRASGRLCLDAVCNISRTVVRRGRQVSDHHQVEGMGRRSPFLALALIGSVWGVAQPAFSVAIASRSYLRQVALSAPLYWILLYLLFIRGPFRQRPKSGQSRRLLLAFVIPWLLMLTATTFTMALIVG